jgi:hypothetical protein
MKTLGLVGLGCIALVSLGAGCGSDADGLTQDGADDLKKCDIHSAHDKFVDAHAADPDHPQAALGFALTSIALLPEDPIVTEILLRIGFTSPMDMQALVFGPDGALARHARGDTCDSISTFIDNTIPYPPLSTPGLDAWTLVDGALTADDFADAALRLSPKLSEISLALETAAGGMSEPVEVEGGCGVGTVTFQAPELYAAAALIETFRSATQLGQAYDWNVGIKEAGQIWNDDAPLVVALLNAHIGRVIDNTMGEDARPIASRAAGLAIKAIDAAKAATVEPNGLFNWTAMPASLLDNARELAVAAQAMTDGPTVIPDLTPMLSLDLSSVFRSPIDFQSFSEPLFTAIDMYTWDVSGTVVEEALTPLFSPNPFSDTVTYTWTLGDQWSAFDTTPVTMPFDRYDAVYNCTATPP